MEVVGVEKIDQTEKYFNTLYFNFNMFQLTNDRGNMGLI
jgi:hypothetical protein